MSFSISPNPPSTKDFRPLHSGDGSSKPKRILSHLQHDHLSSHLRVFITREDARGRGCPARLVVQQQFLPWLLEKSYFDLKPA